MTIKVARSSQSEQQCVENALAAIKAAVEKVPRKWDGVQVSCSSRSHTIGVSTAAAAGNSCAAQDRLQARPFTCDQAAAADGAALYATCMLLLASSHMQALFLKTADSVALPVYQVLPDAAQKIES